MAELPEKQKAARRNCRLFRSSTAPDMRRGGVRTFAGFSKRITCNCRFKREMRCFQSGAQGGGHGNGGGPCLSHRSRRDPPEGGLAPQMRAALLRQANLPLLPGMDHDSNTTGKSENAARQGSGNAEFRAQETKQQPLSCRNGFRPRRAAP